MRDFIREFVGISARTLPLAEPIYAFGSLRVLGPEGFRVLRQRFAESFVSGSGPAKSPHTAVAVGCKGQGPPLEPLMAAPAQGPKRREFADRLSLLEKWATKLKRSSRNRWDALVHRV